MDTNTFSGILDQIKPHTDYIYLHVKGEPFLHPKLDELLVISCEKGFKVNITTNGTLINKVKDMLLNRPALRQINFSLHSFDGNTGLQNRDEYISNILLFVKEAKEKTRMFLSLRLWNLKENEIANDRKNNELLESIEKEFSLPYKIKEVVISDRGIKIDDRIYLNQAHQFKWPDMNEIEDSGSCFCYGLRNQAAILVDGTVVPCCLDNDGVINLGNINETSFSEIIETERAKNIIDGFTRKEAVEKLCKRCGYRTRFE
ncbi:MAG: SPASM domain-containing protein [Eubacteriales bacterium]|nr:SPASM domain-containing protein [Eubacteriales bacterium]